MEERRRSLQELPTAVLKAHAEECGVNVSHSIEKDDLVTQILQAESNEDGTPAVGPAAGQTCAEEIQRRLTADEEFARRLQAEEDLVERLRSHSSVPSTVPSSVTSSRPQSASTTASTSGVAGPSVPVGATVPDPGLQALLSLFHQISVNSQQTREGGPASERLTDLSALLMAVERARDRRGSRAGPNDRSEEGAPPDTVLGGNPLGDTLLQLLSAIGHVQRGVTPAVISSSTATSTFSQEAADANQSANADAAVNKCMVCLENFAVGDELRILPCMHRFHKACVDEWLSRSSECPICKHDLLS